MKFNKKKAIAGLKAVGKALDQTEKDITKAVAKGKKAARSKRDRRLKGALDEYLDVDFSKGFDF